MSDKTIVDNIDYMEEKTRIIYNLSDENKRLKKENERLRAQISKMKNCQNCRHPNRNYEEDTFECDVGYWGECVPYKHKNWEFKDE